jgi:phage-related tail fiber protein
MHCNYYSVVSGPQTGSTSQDVSVRLGNEFPFLSNNGITGFSNTSMALICQFVSGDTRPNPSNWKLIDVTSQVSSGGYLTVSGITGTTFQITENIYQNAPYYYLNDFISIPTNGEPNVLNFGDEYYFYGNFETDIAATIYEMRYLINLNQNQFTNTTNPTWISGTTSYISEIGLYDENKDLIVVSKLQSPQLRQGIQQYVVKLDF